MGVRLFCFLALVAIFSCIAKATDPNQLQDFCVGTNDPHNALFVNGLFCKNPMDVKIEDFHFQGLHIPGDTNNNVGSNVTRVTAMNLPGLNTLGISLARIDVAPYGVNTPHHHPRATEVLTVLEGTFLAAFVTSNQPNGENKLFAQVLKKGDVFIFPQGLIHFETNIGKTPAVALSAFSSQNPGVVTTASAIFGAKPPISVDVLSKSFQLDPKIVKYLQTRMFG
ncbi:germin-like protein subfamily 1 member 17 [Amaranthus tricolor]|uniref:germin-like protein subfamily 1 member 17 n=1 Tax=Amaranthus tricolor TaxID=29722 RepID=UPI0025856569|nr:germin-like protein subfamily 1 member 17 [Amaranthus tricolor]